MCSDAANGEYEGFKVSNEAKCSLKGEATTSESRVHLNDILEELIRLDQQGIFVNPVDESIAPDYSKVIENPMCFLRMREKIHAAQYSAWASFVEDFERVCYNALKYNKKRSRIWNAANLMLRQGKRYLDQQYSKQDLILGLNTMGGCSDQHDKFEATAKFGQAELDVPISGNPCEQIHGTANENLERNVKETKDQTLAKESSTVISEMNAWEQKVATCLPAKSLSEGVSIEILSPVSEEDFRRIFDDQATECSSSFSSTQSESEDESSEVDSELRDGNGGNASTEEVSVTSRRRKRALDVDWKTYRQGIEWRCRWLELRIKRLEAETKKYEGILETTQTHKGQQKQDGSVARTSDMGLNTHRSRVFRRRRRRRAEECGDAMLQMSLHPIFSRYEKQKQRNLEMSSEEGVRDENHQIVEFEDDFEFENKYEDNIVLEKDSYEQYLWQIDALQMHTSDLKDQLIRGPTVPENPTMLISGFETPPRVTGPSTRVQSPGGLGGRSAIRDPKSHGGTPSSRRRNSDFDINNVIMPDSVMANFVEPVRHSFIETPHWRWLKAESAVQDEEESSDEDTDDEAYITRHVKMLAMERQQQYSPLTLNRSRNLSGAKERPKSSIAGRGAATSAAGDYSREAAALPNSFGYIPKKKRKKRVSRERVAACQDSQPM